MAKAKEEFSLEEMLQKIEETIQDMERPDMSLEETFRAYESGLKMIKEANNKIDLVEKEMIILQQDLTDEVEE
jgi:exodeoxyribonuclease VII small subunit